MLAFCTAEQNVNTHVVLDLSTRSTIMRLRCPVDVPQKITKSYDHRECGSAFDSRSFCFNQYRLNRNFYTLKVDLIMPSY